MERHERARKRERQKENKRRNVARAKEIIIPLRSFRARGRLSCSARRRRRRRRRSCRRRRRYASEPPRVVHGTIARPRLIPVVGESSRSLAEQRAASRARNRDRVKKPESRYILGWLTRGPFACRGCSPNPSHTLLLSLS